MPPLELLIVLSSIQLNTQIPLCLRVIDAIKRIPVSQCRPFPNKRATAFLAYGLSFLGVLIALQGIQLKTHFLDKELLTALRSVQLKTHILDKWAPCH